MTIGACAGLGGSSPRFIAAEVESPTQANCCCPDGSNFSARDPRSGLEGRAAEEPEVSDTSGSPVDATLHKGTTVPARHDGVSGGRAVNRATCPHPAQDGPEGR